MLKPCVAQLEGIVKSNVKTAARSRACQQLYDSSRHHPFAYKSVIHRPFALTQSWYTEWHLFPVVGQTREKWVLRTMLYTLVLPSVIKKNSDE